VTDRIHERVRKLLALSRSSNEHEAEAAALKAQELLQKYHLDRADVEEEDLRDTTADHERDRVELAVVGDLHRPAIEVTHVAHSSTVEHAEPVIQDEERILFTLYVERDVDHPRQYQTVFDRDNRIPRQIRGIRTQFLERTTLYDLLQAASRNLLAVCRCITP